MGIRKGWAELEMHVQGQLVSNSSTPILRATLAGLGVAWIPEDLVQEYISSGKLVRVLEDWRPLYQGYHIYYASRRHASPAFALLIDALRHPS